MKLPAKIIETFGHNDKSQSTLVRTMWTKSTPPPVIIEPIIDCTGATTLFEFSLQQPNYNGAGGSLNHSELIYNISVDDVDYGEFNMGELGYVNVGELTLDVSMDSSGTGYINAYTRNGSNTPNIVKFTARSDMVGANIWGVNMDSNPTLIYNSVTRAVKVCLTSTGNT